MIWGYVRISTTKQNIERQITNIKNIYPKATIVKEAYTGRSMNRPEFTKLMKTIKSGDTLICDELSRFSRNAEEGIKVYEELYNKGVEIEFIKEPHLNTSTYRSAIESSISMTNTNVDFIIEGINKYLMALAREQIRLGFSRSEQEVEFLRQRVKEGLHQAKLDGAQIGRKKGSIIETNKSKRAKEIIKKHAKSFGGTLGVDEIIKLCGCSRNSYFKYRKEILRSEEYTNIFFNII